MEKTITIYCKNTHSYHEVPRGISLIQLKVIQEALSLIVFTVVSGLLFGSLNLHWNHILAFILLIASVALVFYK